MSDTGKTILIVDDSDMEFDLICWGLRQNGFDTPTRRAETAEAALEILGIVPGTPDAPAGHDRPMLILLDIGMPGLGGLGFLETLKQMPEPLNIPVVVMSSSSNPADVAMSYQLGAAAYVQKPATMQDYISKMRDVMAFCFE
jgi:CheY-like chemotaxis protein